MNPFKKNKKQVGIFVTAGFPERESLGKQLLFLQEKGVDFIEIGIPFSDPMADGPMIQYSSEVAIQNGMHIDLIFEQLEEVRAKIHIPIVFMGYFNPVLHYGLEKFLQKCSANNISGLIFPDLNHEIVHHKYQNIFGNHSIPLIHLITPATSNHRIVELAELSRNAFVYLIGQNSTTGTAFDQTDDLQKRYKEIKKLCESTPVFLGFGIDSSEKKEIGFQSCDGVIVGSAYLKALEQNLHETFLQETMQI